MPKSATVSIVKYN